ncbi:hypothetical protein T265_04338 [Opisthorchis viverrini]|uniref:Uncharacterized protein n=1 Tax=Opisthorchis viverrini TaxID=6198 RepID=A0A075A071_OPIVI|nr:hypothetical protein T265_04338 [Opisthorchis viverrini]KER28960.1 hypothetical protein T265_04338 [Opisthorchis viverrini]
MDQKTSTSNTWSRHKSRKILGVGDRGDSRTGSKLVQLLGENEPDESLECTLAYYWNWFIWSHVFVLGVLAKLLPDTVGRSVLGKFVQLPQNTSAFSDEIGQILISKQRDCCFFLCGSCSGTITSSSPERFGTWLPLTIVVINLLIHLTVAYPECNLRNLRRRLTNPMIGISAGIPVVTEQTDDLKSHHEQDESTT